MFTDLEPSRTHYRTEYLAFKNAAYRCTDLTDKDYGGRGIKFLYSGFKEFMQDLGPKPCPELSLDRINNEGNYEPGNCRWTTAAVQVKNRRTKMLSRLAHRKITEKTLERCIQLEFLIKENPKIKAREIAEKMGVKIQTVYNLKLQLRAIKGRFVFLLRKIKCDPQNSA